MPRSRSRRVFSKEFKLQVLGEIDAGASVAEAARIHHVHPETIRVWKRTLRKYGERSFAGNGRAYSDEAERSHRHRARARASHARRRILKKALSVLKELERKSGGKR